MGRRNRMQNDMQINLVQEKIRMEIVTAKSFKQIDKLIKQD